MLLYITGNEQKIITANKYLKNFGITVEGLKLDDIIEPQLDDIEEISKSKARQAFKKVGKPLIVSDAEWRITALNGFPGPYLHFINERLTAEDFLNLMKNKKNREVILRECVTYVDKDQLKTFVRDTKGSVLNESSGDATPFDQIVTFREDKMSVAKCQNENISRIPQSELWNDVGNWLKENYT